MDYFAILKDIKDYYANLLIVQYHNKPKAIATIKLLAELFWVNMLLLQIRESFNLETAIGKQLDIIGKWVGVNRIYDGVFYSFRAWFSLIGWNDEPDNLQGGFSTFETYNEGNGGFLTYQDTFPNKNKLDDTGFRWVIGLKIIKNNISATCKNIDDAIWQHFNGRVYTTWEPEALTYHYPSDLSEVMQVAAYKNVLPRPTGIRIILKEIIDNG